MDMRTDLTAVPHAGLGFQFLRVQVRKPKRKWRSVTMFKGHQNQQLQRARDRLTTFVRDCKCISTLPQPEKTCKQPEPGRTTRVNVFIIFSQVRAICVQIAYHSKLEVSSLSGDFKNAHRSPAAKRRNKSKNNPKGSL